MEAIETPAAPLLSASPEADQALSISMLLAPKPASQELRQSAQREAMDQAARLRDALRVRPEAWNNVYDLLCCLENGEVAVRIASLLSDAVQEPQERFLVEAMRQETSSRSRRVALALLSHRNSSDTLAAAQGAADDRDPRLRREALESLVRRRQDAPDAVQPTFTRRASLEQDPELLRIARGLSGDSIEPLRPASPPSKGLALKIKASSKSP